MQEPCGLSTAPNAPRTISGKAWNSPAEYPSWVARFDVKGSDGTMLNPIFWKKVGGQKYPRRWEIAEHQTPSIKVLFKTNTKSHEHLSIGLLIREQDTIGKPKKTKSGIQPRNHVLLKVQSHRMWWGAASLILNDTPAVCTYTSYNRTHIKNAYIYIYIYINTELLDGNTGHQEETHPTHRFRRLFLDLLSMGWRGRASAIGAIKLPPSCSSPKLIYQSIHIV